MIIKIQNLIKEVGQQSRKTKLRLEFCLILIIATFSIRCSTKDKHLQNEINIDSISMFPKSSRVEDDIAANLESLKMAIRDSARIESFAIAMFLKDTLPKDIFALKRLQSLSIIFTYIDSIPGEICNLQNLETLRLDRNKLVNIDELKCLVKLKNLSLTGNKLTSLTSLQALTQLEFLDISSNDFSKGINSDLPVNLLELYISNGNLMEFSTEILKLRKLKRLIISDNLNLKVIPNEISKLTQLQELVINGTSIPRVAINQIQKLMPWCKISYSGLELNGT